MLRTVALVGLIVVSSLGMSVQPVAAAGPRGDARDDTQSDQSPPRPATFAARASIRPGAATAGGATGTLFTLTVHNTGTATSIGSVLVARPSQAWTLTACPVAPTGWQAQGSAQYCEYHATRAGAGYLAPGAQSSAFQFRARAASGRSNVAGAWTVLAGSGNLSLAFAVQDGEGDFQSGAGDLQQVGAAAPAFVRATPEGSGLTPTAYVLEITAAGVATAGLLPGAPCPAVGLGSAAVAGSTVAIAVCGRNRSTVTLRPAANRSALAGSFIALPGSFISSPIPPGPGVVVLAEWTGVTVARTAAEGLSVTAAVAAGPLASAPPFTATGLIAAEIPVARDDAFTLLWSGIRTVAAPGVLANDTHIGSSITGYGAVTGHEQPALGSPTSTAAGGSVTLAADGSFSYAPAIGFSGADSFRYALSGVGGTSTATVSLTVVRPPGAVADHYATAQNSPRTVPAPGVFANDRLSGAALSSYTQPRHGTVVLNPDGSFFYSPAPGFSGSDSFTYTVANLGGASTATVTLEVLVPVVASVTPPPDDTFSRSAGQIFIGDLVQLAPCPADCGSSDPQLRFQWVMTQQPAGSHARLSSATAPAPTFVPDTPGSYQLSVSVSDSAGSVGLAGLTLATQTCGANPVLAVIGASTSAGARSFDPWTLTATVITADDSSQCPARFAPTYTYQWSVTSAPAASTLSPSTGPVVQFAAHDSGTYVVSVRVTASNGQTATASIEQSASCAQAAPSASAAVAGGPQYNVGDRVSLTATGASSCISAPAFTYSWTLVAQPPGSRAIVSDASSATPTFVPDVAGGSYSLSVVVKDQYGHASAPASVAFQTTNCGVNPVIASIVDGGVAKDFDPHNLTASVSSADADPSHCPARFAPTYSYQWSVVSPPSGFTLSASTAPAAQFAANQVGTFVVRLTVTTSSGQSATVERAINTTCNATPVVGARAGGPLPHLGDTVSLTATVDSSACWSQPPAYSYAWSMVTRPAGSVALLSNPSAATPTFVPDAAGSYDFRVQVTDAFGHAAAPAVTSVTVLAPPQAPVISAPTFVTVGRAYTASLPVRSGMTYSWTISNGVLLTSPAGTLSGGTNLAQFTAGSVGPVTLVAVEIDPTGASSATGTVTLTAVPAPVAPDIAGLPAQVTIGDSLALSLASPGSRPGMTYDWSALVDGGSAATGTGPTFALTTGAGSSLTITVRETNAAGDSASRTVASAIHPAPVAPAILGLGPAVTVGIVIPLAISARSGMTYSWTASGGVLNRTTGPSVSLTPSAAGTVQVSVTEVNGAGATATSIAASVAYPAPNVAATVTPAIATAGSPATLTVNYSGCTAAATFSDDPATVSLGPSPASVAMVRSTAVSGTVTVTCVNPAGTTAVASAPFTFVSPPQAPTITGLPASGLSRGISVALSVVDRSSSSAAYTYGWSISGTGVGTFSSPIGTSTMFTPTAAGSVTIWVTETNAAGDSATSMTVTTIT